LAYLLVLPGSRARIVRCGGCYDPQLVKRSSEWVSEYHICIIFPRKYLIISIISPLTCLWCNVDILHAFNMCKVARSCSVAEVERRGDKRFCPNWEGQHIRTGPGSRNVSLNYENILLSCVEMLHNLCEILLRNMCKLARSCSIGVVDLRSNIEYWTSHIKPTWGTS